MRFSQFFRQHREKIGTVRHFAKETNYDISYISRLENGVTLPPKDPVKLQKLGIALGLTKGTDEWQTFMDLAAVAKSELPTDLRGNEKIASVLLAFYRTLRNEKLDKTEAEKLLNLIKNSGKEE